MSDDPKVSRKYRELGAEEPPRALDDAILAAASRQARPWTRRWAIPLSLAAVVMLSVTVTLRLQHEQPGIESPMPQVKAKEPVPATPAPVAEAQPRPKVEVQQKKSVARKEPEPFANAMQDKVAADKPSTVAAAAAPAPAAAQMSALRRDARAAEFNTAGALAATPERELERIAELRKQGLHDEADKALAEFRKRYPDYTIPEAMRLRVERR
jgi:outer membrane biosynthesis protein TonB